MSIIIKEDEVKSEKAQQKVPKAKHHMAIIIKEGEVKGQSVIRQQLYNYIAIKHFLLQKFFPSL